MIHIKMESYTKLKDGCWVSRDELCTRLYSTLAFPKMKVLITSFLGTLVLDLFRTFPMLKSSLQEVTVIF